MVPLLVLIDQLFVEAHRLEGGVDHLRIIAGLN